MLQATSDQIIPREPAAEAKARLRVRPLHIALAAGGLGFAAGELMAYVRWSGNKKSA